MDPKQAAIDLWTADPCEAHSVDLAPGSRRYFRELRAAREEYAPWMGEALDYATARGRRVLDVGCGQGIDVVNFALAGAVATGVDLTPRHVELAREHAAAAGVDADVVEGDAEALPFADCIFDRVSSNGVLHHVPRMEAALREVQRVLEPGGEARILVYNRRSLHYWIDHVLYRGILRGELASERSMQRILSRSVEHSTIGARALVRVYSAGQMRRLLRGAGFTDVATSIHHFRPNDTFVTGALRDRLDWLRDPAKLDRIGRIAGWYCLARGRRPALDDS